MKVLSVDNHGADCELNDGKVVFFNWEFFKWLGLKRSQVKVGSIINL